MATHGRVETGIYEPSGEDADETGPSCDAGLPYETARWKVTLGRNARIASGDDLESRGDEVAVDRQRARDALAPHDLK